MMRLSYREVADFLHHRDSVWRSIAMLKAYFDESGTHEGAYVTSIAGYVATEKTWSEIEAEWAKVLAYFAGSGVKTFHTADCLSAIGRGEFVNLNEHYRLSIVKQLSDILVKSDVQPIWSSVIIDDWHEVMGGANHPDRKAGDQPSKVDDWEIVPDVAFKRRFPEPYFLCFEHICLQINKWSKQTCNGEMVAPMFAFHPEYTAIMENIGRAYAASNPNSEVLGPIAWGYPSKIIPLQAADMVAHEFSEYWRHTEYDELKFGDIGPRKLLSNATAFNGMAVGGCFDGPALRSAIRRFSDTGSIL